MSPPKRTPKRFGGKPKARRRPEARSGPPALVHPGPKPSSRPGYRPSVILPGSQAPLSQPPPRGGSGRAGSPQHRKPRPAPVGGGQRLEPGVREVANVVSIDKLAESAFEVAMQVERAVFADGRRADRAIAFALRNRRDLAAPDHRFISRAVFALFRWRGWVEPLRLERPEERLLLSCLLDFTSVHPACRVWARLLGKHPDRLLSIGDAPNWTARGEGWKRINEGRNVSADPWRLFPDWLREHLPLPPGGGPPKMKYLEFLASLQARSPLWVRAQAEDEQKTWAELADLGLKPWIHRRLTRAAKLEPDADVHHQPAFERGDLEIQDLASQAVALACDPDPGERWWDACAGAGGKALHLAALMKGKGLVVATDVHEGRLKEAVRRARKSPFRNITTKPWDGKHVVGKAGKYDGVLVDAPCSAIGTWRRNPDARWTLGPEAVDRLAELQAQILRAAAAGVRPGGTLVYSVCTITIKETQGVLRPFLADHPEFHLDPFPHPLLPESTDGTLVLWPQESDTDGMFIARMIRTDPKPKPDTLPKPKSKTKPTSNPPEPAEEAEAAPVEAEAQPIEVPGDPTSTPEADASHV